MKKAPEIIEWMAENKKQLAQWMESENILQFNARINDQYINSNRIYLYSEEQMQYFKLRWG